MFNRRRQNRKLVRVARMLRELDACTASARRPPERRAGGHVELGRAA